MLLDVVHYGLPVALSLYTSIVFSVLYRPAHLTLVPLFGINTLVLNSGGIILLDRGSELMREGVIIRPGIFKLMGVILLEGEGL